MALPENADESIVNRPVPRVNVAILALSKAILPMLVTEFGIVTAPRLVVQKDDDPIVVTPLGMFTVDNELENANK